MSKFRPKLARYNTVCCEQVMPVPVIPICGISCCLPQPICQVTPLPEYIPLPPPGPCEPPACIVDNAPLEQEIIPMNMGNYCPMGADPPTGSIISNTTETVPTGYLLCDGFEVSRTTYNALYLVIGTYYGNGDGSTTFNLPNITSDGSCVLTYIIKI